MESCPNPNHGEIQEHYRQLKILLYDRQLNELDEIQKESLNDINNEFTKSRKGKKTVWQAIQNFHRKSNFLKLKDLEDSLIRELTTKYGNLAEAEAKAKELLDDLSTTRKEYQRHLSELAEVNVEESIANIMTGRPGLLIRGLKCVKNTFEHLRGVFGDIAPHCETHCGDGNHKSECFQMEADIVLLYPGEDDILNVVIIEVKRPEKEGCLNDNLVTGALAQQRRTVKLILLLLQELPTNKLNTKTFMAFPETTQKEGCQDCQDNILYAEDFQDPKNLKTRLNIGPPFHLTTGLQRLNIAKRPSSVDCSNPTFLSVCARLWQQNEKKIVNCTDENLYMIQCEEKVAKKLLVFGDDQRRILEKFQENSHIKNFLFSGGSGTGKTVMALQVVNMLIKRYLGLGAPSVYVYAVTHQRQDTVELPLLNDVKQQIKVQDADKVHIQVKTFGELCKDSGVDKSKFKCPERNAYILPDLVPFVAQKLKEKHKESPVIFFNDEMMVFGNKSSLDWSKVCPPGCAPEVTEPKDIVNLLMAINPGTIGRGISGNMIFDSVEGHFQTASCDLDEVLFIPNHPSFMTPQLHRRYRNTKKIQQFTKFVGHDQKIYLTTEPNETPAPCLLGDMPIWRDLGCSIEIDMAKVKESVQQMLKELDRYSGKEMALLYDSNLPKKIQEYLESVKKPKYNMKEKYFKGSESNAVIYFGTGHLEAFSRAKQMLAIITYCNDPGQLWYQRYNKSLEKAAEEGLLRKLE